MPKKVHLLIRHIWHAETLVRSPRMWSVKPYMAGRAPTFPQTTPKSSNDLLLMTYPTLLRYYRAHCLGRQDDRIRQISQASNVKKPTRFMVTSWINSDIRSVCFFCHRTSTSATLCQDMFGNITTSSPKFCQFTNVLPTMRVVRQSQKKEIRTLNGKTFCIFFLHFYSRSRLISNFKKKSIYLLTAISSR